MSTSSTPQHELTSLWRDRPPIQTDPDLADRYDDVVVGAGLTGLVTALLLARSGRSVAVVEARQVGAVTTGNTTGKVSLLQGTRLSRIMDRQSDRVARAYVDANREGQAWLLRFCDDHGVSYQRRTAVTYAADERSLEQARAPRTRLPAVSVWTWSGATTSAFRFLTPAAPRSTTRHRWTPWMSWRPWCGKYAAKVAPW